MHYNEEEEGFDLVNAVVNEATCFPLMLLFPLSLYITNSFPFSLLPTLFLSLDLALISTMSTENKGKPLPKFGEWDVNNPASAEGFTVIFSKASDEKKTKKASGAGPTTLVSPQRTQNSDHNDSQNPKAKNKWLCFR